MRLMLMTSPAIGVTPLKATVAVTPVEPGTYEDRDIGMDVDAASCAFTDVEHASIATATRANAFLRNIIVVEISFFRTRAVCIK
jgi:hypothetical protein